MHLSARASISGARISRIDWIAGLELLVVAVLLAFSQIASAGVNVLSVLGPEGGAIVDIEYHPTNPSIVFASTVGGFYRSTNGGVSWQRVSDSRALGNIAVHPVTHKLFLAGGELLVSDDDGVTLRVAENFPARLRYGQRVAVSEDGSAIYVVGAERLFQSQDNGASWQDRSLPGDSTMDSVHALVIDPDDSRVLYVLRGDEDLFVSHDGASSWARVELPEESGAMETFVHDIAIAKTTPRRLWIAGGPRAWRTADEGQTWTPNSFTSYSSAIAIDPRDANTVYLDGSEGLLRSMDGGTTWNRIAVRPWAGEIKVIAPSPFQSRRLLAGGSEGLGLTTDGGQTWTWPNAGIVATNVNRLVPVAGSNRTYVATYSNGGYYLEGGSSTLVGLNNERLRDLNGGALGVRTFLSQSDQLFAALNSGVVVRSTDGGQSWDEDRSWPRFVDLIASTPLDPNVILASGGFDVYQTLTGGLVWDLASGFPANSVKHTIVVAPSNPAISYAGLGEPMGSITEGFGVYRSRDFGRTWSPANRGMENARVQALAVDPRDERVVYAGTFSGFMKSTDGGDSWTKLDWGSNSIYGEAWAIAIDPIHPDIVFACQSLGRVARSVDRGATWQTPVDQPIESAYLCESMALDPSDSSRVLWGTNSNGLHEIRIQPDLSIAASQSSTMTENTAATLAYTIANHGPFDATGVTSTIALGASAQSVNAQSADAACTANEGTIICKHTILRTDATSTIKIAFTYPASGEHKIDASIAGDQPDFSIANNAASITVSVAARSSSANGGAGGGSGSGGGGGGGSSSPSILLLLGLLAAIARVSRDEAQSVRVRGHSCGDRNPAGG